MTESLKEKLHSKKAPDRRKAAREIRKANAAELGPDLLQAYEREALDSRTWETQKEMLLSLGAIGYKPALAVIEPILRGNAAHDMVTIAAAESYVRLKRQSPADAGPVIELLKRGSLSVAEGAVTPLAYDAMNPSTEQINEIIQLCWDLHRHPDRVGMEHGLADPRYSVAAACVGWPAELTRPFLEHCLQTAGRDTPLIYVAENSLKGKRVKLR
jgi:hypothetical protein